MLRVEYIKGQPSKRTRKSEIDRLSREYAKRVIEKRLLRHPEDIRDELRKEIYKEYGL